MKDRLFPFAISFAVTCLFFINVCDWMFDCGCHSLWAGADAMCNVHLANSAALSDLQPRHPGICGCDDRSDATTTRRIGLARLEPRLTRTIVCLILFPAGMAAVGALLGVSTGTGTESAS